MSKDPLPPAKRTVRYFVSYTRDDAKLPDKLLAELRKKLGACRDYDFVPWRDTDILVGTDWDASIQAALRECDFGLLLVSPAFLGKKYVTEKELPHFVGGGKPCVPVTLSRIDFEEMDLKGLEPTQFFGLVGKNDVYARSFEECRTAQQKSEFAHQLFLKIKARLDHLFGDASASGAPRAGGLDEPAYRRHIREHFRLLDIEAIGGEAVYRDVELQAVFIPQHARDCREWLPEKLEAPGALTLELAELHEQRTFHEAAPRPILELLGDAAVRCRVVLGAPGAGKTSLTRVRLLAWERDAAARELPLLIELRRFHKSRAPDFLTYLATDPDLVFHFPAEALRPRLAAAGVEVVFDGLDEIFEPEPRERAARQIAAFAAEFPQARILVTSRLIGYPGRTLRDAGFAHWLLAAFDDEQVAAFIEHWTAGAITHPSDREIVRTRLGGALGSPVLREMAGNPLLLTLMAVLARESDLPRDRGELFKQAADLLLKRWDARRYLATQLKIENVTLDHKDKADLLRDLAWAMQTGQHGLKGNLLPEAKVSAAIETMLTGRIADPGTRRAATEALIDQLTGRNYILCHVGGAQFAFVHRGFLEFFASEYVLHIVATRPATAVEELAAIYRSHAYEDAWQEVLILAATRLDPAVAEPVLLPLVKGVDGEDVGTAAFIGSPHPFVLACRVLARSREPQKFAMLAGHCRADLEKWIPQSPDYIHGDGWVALLGETFPDARSRALLEELARRDEDTYARCGAVGSLAERFADAQTRALLEELARRDEDTDARSQAVGSLAERFADAQTRALLGELARRDEDTGARHQAVASLAERFADAQTRALLEELARRDEATGARSQAVVSLANRFADAQIRALLEELARRDEDTSARSQAVDSLANRFADAQTRALLEELAHRDEDTDARSRAVASLAERYHESPETASLLRSIVVSPKGREVVQRAVSSHYARAEARAYLLTLLTEADPSERPGR